MIRNSSIHAGIRAPLARVRGDLRNDLRCGFEIVTARDLDRIGIAGVTEKLRDRVTNTPVYISVDIDVLDVSHLRHKSGANLIFCSLRLHRPLGQLR